MNAFRKVVNRLGKFYLVQGLSPLLDSLLNLTREQIVLVTNVSGARIPFHMAGKSLELAFAFPPTIVQYLLLLLFHQH